jgi:ABC-type molybdate transport system substrate-binding protein
MTVFSAAIASRSQAPAAARALLDYLTLPASAAAVRASGMEPLQAAR